jgi:hypothetical protein
MYHSLVDHYTHFTLYVFCFDDVSFSVLRQLHLPHIIPFQLKDFEDPVLKRTKKKKQKYYEYYWAYKPYLVLLVMDRYKAEVVTYIDCDFMFFASPEPIFDEMADADILIQPNNFSYEEMAQFIPVGYYCSCFESFRNNKNGRFVLHWWYKQCVKWCFASFEKGRFADQKYLDDWRSRFKNVKEITLIGANLAPWNQQKYDVSMKKSQIMVNRQPLIYYHYHSFKMNFVNYDYLLTGDRENFYTLSKSLIRYVYAPYIRLLKKVQKKLNTLEDFSLYAKSNPNGEVKLIEGKTKLSFSSFKEKDPK